MDMRVKWTIEEILKIALIYKNRGEFRSNNSKAYQAACKIGINQFCSHMPKRKDKKGKNHT
jgi:hypothetical protein